MSENFEAVQEVADPLRRIADAVEAMLEPFHAQRAEQLDQAVNQIRAILWDLYPDTCARHGLEKPTIT